VATEIWDLCRAQAQTVDELCTQLEARYEAPPDVLRRDVQELVDELVRIGALVREPRTADT
jgi:hypothetical protein